MLEVGPASRSPAERVLRPRFAATPDPVAFKTGRNTCSSRPTLRS